MQGKTIDFKDFDIIHSCLKWWCKLRKLAKGSAITYLGKNLDRFAEVFGDIGEIKISYKRRK